VRTPPLKTLAVGMLERAMNGECNIPQEMVRRKEI
jgi:hypothetical protein